MSCISHRITRKPREYIVALQEASASLALAVDPSSSKILKDREIQVGFEGSFGLNSVSPRGLLSSQLNSLVEIEGIVTKCSTVKPKLIRAVHYCQKTKQYSSREFRDATAMDIGLKVRGIERLPTSSILPTKDDKGNPLELEPGLCVYKDYQTVTVQEMPERAKVGQLPRSVEVVLEHDLVDHVKPGDRVRTVGVYRPLASVQNGQTSGIFKSVLLCNNVSIIGKEIGAVRLTGADIQHIR